MEFKKYQHVERFGTSEVDGIEYGQCYIFPKIDGSNGQTYMKDNKLMAGSRNRELSLEEDNQGFYDFVLRNSNLVEFHLEFPEVRLYGEWLVPHTLRTYREDAWRRFYIFDVEYLDNLLPYDQYLPMLQKYNLDFIIPLAIINNPTYDNLVAKLPANTFLIEDGKGDGEGIVIKNYDYINKYGRQTWAKIVKTEFKEKNVLAMGLKPTDGSFQVEEAITSEFIDGVMIDKILANIKNETNQNWRSEFIPRLLSTVYYEFIREESWNFIKKHKMPKIDFKVLNRYTVLRVKSLKPELF